MTEAEIEKQVEEYLKNTVCKGCSPSCEGICWKVRPVKQAFQDGAKWGAENAIEWHDLRKDPNDLPKEYGEYQVCYENSLVKGRKEHAIWQYVYEKWEHTARVIAWCELPQFKE